MKLENGEIFLSPSDAARFSYCKHASYLDLKLLKGDKVETSKQDDFNILVQNAGINHEKSYLDFLKNKGLSIIPINQKLSSKERFAETISAINSGFDIIYQGRLEDKQWVGDADFICKTYQSSKLGDYSYRIVDTKLSKTPKASHVMQIMIYSIIISKLTGQIPTEASIISPDKENTTNFIEHKFQTNKFIHYIKRRMELIEGFISTNNETIPAPCSYCDYCEYKNHCKKIWEKEKSIFEITGVTKNQVLRLGKAGIHNLKELIASKGSISNFNSSILEKIKHKAKLRLDKLNGGKPKYYILGNDKGLENFLPTESPADIYFDIEGDPLINDGLEYLFGYVKGNKETSKFNAIWAHDKNEEKEAIKQLIKFLHQHCLENKNAHIYHYNSYEVNALRKLSQKYAVMEEELDSLLRAERFVDLYKFIQASIITSEKGLSLKDLEVFYTEKRDEEITDAASSVVMYEKWRETLKQEILEEIEAYNEQDCRSMPLMRQWLESVVFENQIVHRDTIELSNASIEYQTSDQFSNDEAAIANSIANYHHREQKPYWWKFFDTQIRELNELLPDASVIAGLKFLKQKLNLYEFKLEDQEYRFGSGDVVKIISNEGESSFGSRAKIHSIDEKNKKIVLESQKTIPPNSIIFEQNPPSTKSIEKQLYNFYLAVKNGTAKETYPLAYNIFKGEKAVNKVQQNPVDKIEDHNRYNSSKPIFIQGPPGTGKTFLASNFLANKMEKTKKHEVYIVTSQSHKAIENLLQAVSNKFTTKNYQIIKYGGKAITNDKIEHISKSADLNFRVQNAASNNQPILIGITVFSLCSWGAFYDLIVVDEAGQYSLSNTIAVSMHAKYGVFLGDQNQLPNVSQANHPHPVDKSVMEYCVGDYKVIPDEVGIFISKSWRLHPKICEIVSKIYYENQLTYSKEMAKRKILSDGSDVSGLDLVKLNHNGCSQRSDEEVKRITDDYDKILDEYIFVEDGKSRKLNINDILVVAPFNAQVKALIASLPDGARVGTVDKFQGQEAPVCLISMTSSSGDETPRGIGFLLSPNRLNVAISRAMCVAKIYISNQIFETECRAIEDMILLNDIIYLDKLT